MLAWNLSPLPHPFRSLHRWSVHTHRREEFLGHEYNAMCCAPKILTTRHKAYNYPHGYCRSQMEHFFASFCLRKVVHDICMRTGLLCCHIFGLLRAEF